MAALVLVLAWSAFPIALIVLASLRMPNDIFSEKGLLPFSATTQNYVNLWKRWPDFFHNLQNSLEIALGATALTLVISFLAGYVYARRQGRLLTASAFFMILVRLLPPIVLTLPLFPAGNWSIKAFMIQVPRLRKNAQYRMISTVRVSFSINQLTAGNSGSVSTMGGSRRTRIMKKADAVRSRPCLRVYT